MKTRDEIIESMCRTFRHDYGIDKNSFSGMTAEGRESLRRQMAQIFDNDIAPNMEFRKETRRTKSISDGTIRIESFELTERQQRAISRGLRYGPDAAAMKEDGTFWEAEEEQSGWMKWISSKFLGRS